MNPAYNYGGDYTTYVLWAISPQVRLIISAISIVGRLGSFKSGDASSNFRDDRNRRASLSGEAAFAHGRA